MSVIYISKLHQQGIVHPKYFNAQDIYSLILDHDITVEDVSVIDEFNNLKLEMISTIELISGFTGPTVFFDSEDNNYAYVGSVWESEEAVNNAVTLLKENHLDLIVRYNVQRAAILQKFNIAYSYIGIFPIDNIELLSFNAIDVLANDVTVPTDDPFNFA